MRKILVFTLALLASAVWLQAQSGYPGLDAWQAAGRTSSLTTVQGCLQSSGGDYTVTDNTGAIHQLQGNTARLSRYVGRQVEITGKPGLKTTDTTEKGIASSATEEPALTVEGAKQISETCSSATP
jgi:hypothetical protein